ncbi:TonB-dependent receptor [Tunicatimonas pelagia]|uniref:TonB-dependent receptor n=1 Tax=Tunicatimonas pelagia TaxID=931531 RepID=UPI002666BF2C|nr:TonB-dependent receptor [Tunicatimonas pelagia]WKN41892.1 carboxypeptidase-like regulatory domain-containing protein [Tunicatimonas pelagia]
MKLFATLVGVIAIITGSFSQVPPTDSCQYQVAGQVLDISSQQPLAFASVQIEGTTRGAVTNEAGYFQITQVCYREFDLVISFVGYKTVIHHHDPFHKNPQIFLAPDSLTLKSVVIEEEALTGELFSSSVSELSTQDLATYQSQSLGDLASKITGVSVLKTGQNIAKPIIHGLHSNRVLVVNNGVRHEFQNWGSEHAPEIDPSLAENIKVVKGAATVRYGPEALGGVLLIEPPKMDFLTSFQGEIQAVGQSNGRSGEGTVQLQKGFHRVAFLGQASVVQQGDLHTPDYQLTNTGKKEQSGAFTTRFHYGNIDLVAHFSHFDQELGILRSAVTGNLIDLVNAIEQTPPPLTQPFSYGISNPRQRVRHNMAKIRGQWFGNNQSVEIQYAIQQNNRQEFDVRRGTINLRPAIDLQLISHSLDAAWEHPSFHQWEGRLGAQGLVQDNNNLPGTSTIPFIPNYNVNRIGLYLIERRPLGNDWVEAGIRYDYQTMSIRGRNSRNDVYRNNLNFQNITATLGLVKQLSDYETFRTNLGTAWRPPNVSELYSFGRHQTSIDYGLWRHRFGEDGSIDTDNVLDENDRPAPSEVGFKWIGTYESTRESQQTEVTAYINYIQNYIYTKPAGITQTIRGAFPFFIYDQDDALLMGVDASTTLEHAHQLSSKLQGSYVWAKNVTRNEYFVGLPPANVQYQLSQRLGKWGVLSESSWSVSANYTFRQFQAPRTIPARELEAAERNIFAENDAIFDLLPPPNGYFLLDLSWSGQIDHFTLGVQIQNTLNTSYRNYTDRLRYFADETGRNFLLSLKYSF